MSSHRLKGGAHMRSDGSKDNAHSMVAGADDNHVVVPEDQVTGFVNTLHIVLDSYAHSRKLVEDTRVNGADEMKAMRVHMYKAMKKTDKNRKRSVTVLSELLIVEKYVMNQSRSCARNTGTRRHGKSV